MGRAAVADATRRRLILPPHTPGAKSSCLLCQDRRTLCCEESVRGKRHVGSDGCFSDEACVGNCGCVSGVE